MEQQTICTAYEAAAAWDLSRDDSIEFEGLLLVLDLDHGSAGLCQHRSGQSPEQVWEYPGSLSSSFFRDAVWVLMPGCSSPNGAQQLRESLTGLFGSRSQKNYFRAGRTEDLSLPDVVLEGQVYSMTCAGLAEVFEHSHGQALRQMLSEARAELSRRGAEANCRILPVGELAKLYIAEYMVRETFLARPLLTDDRLRLCVGREDPAQIVEQGYEIYRQKYSPEKAIGKHLRLQVLRRTGSGAVSELLTLATGDRTYSQLRQIQYVGPICIADDEPLTLYVDSELLRISIPPDVLRSTGPLRCAEIGIGAEDENLYLSLRFSGGSTSRLALHNIC